jgi:ribosomal protein S18 acetylase RimI-like enzyme
MNNSLVLPKAIGLAADCEKIVYTCPACRAVIKLPTEEDVLAFTCGCSQRIYCGSEIFRVVSGVAPSYHTTTEKKKQAFITAINGALKERCLGLSGIDLKGEVATVYRKASKARKDVISIGAAGVADLPAVSALFHKYIGNHDWHTQHYLLNALHVSCTSPHKTEGYCQIMVAKDNSTEACKIIGAVLLEPVSERRTKDTFGADFEVSAIAVDEAYRGQGIAEKLINRVGLFAVGSIVCHAWADSGKQARLHRALKRNGYNLKQAIDGYWLNTNDCSCCVDYPQCKKACANHIYLRSG